MSRYPRKKPKNESKSKKEIRLLSNTLWKLVSEYVRRRDGKCVCCGQIVHWKELHAGHYIHGRLDFSELNLHGSCVGCNTYRGGNLTQYALYLIRTKGNGILETIDQMARLETQALDRTGKLTHVGKELNVELLNDLIAYYKGKLEKLDRL